MRRVVIAIASAFSILYLATWLLGVPAVRGALPHLVAAELRRVVRPAERATVEDLLRTHPPIVQTGSVYAAFPGVVVATFDLELGQRYFPAETRVIVWFGVGAKLLNVR